MTWDRIWEISNKVYIESLGEQIEVFQLVLVRHRPLGTAGLEVHVPDEVAVRAELLVAEGELQVGDGVLLDELDLGVVELGRVVGEVLRGHA